MGSFNIIMSEWFSEKMFFTDVIMIKNIQVLHFKNSLHCFVIFVESSTEICSISFFYVLWAGLPGSMDNVCRVLQEWHFCRPPGIYDQPGSLDKKPIGFCHWFLDYVSYYSWVLQVFFHQDNYHEWNSIITELYNLTKLPQLNWTYLSYTLVTL